MRLVPPRRHQFQQTLFICAWCLFRSCWQCKQCENDGVFKKTNFGKNHASKKLGSCNGMLYIIHIGMRFGKIYEIIISLDFFGPPRYALSDSTISSCVIICHYLSRTIGWRPKSPPKNLALLWGGYRGTEAFLELTDYTWQNDMRVSAIIQRQLSAGGCRALYLGGSGGFLFR